MSERNAAAPDLKPETSQVDQNEPSPELRLAIETAQRAFVCPQGFKLSKVPTGDTRSSMYDYGVRVEEIQTDISDMGKKRKVPGRFYCMASQKCRDACVSIKISNLSTSPATEHLQGLHNVVSKRSAQVQRTKTSGMGITASSTTPPATPKAEKFGSTTPRNGNASGLGDLRERDLVLKYIKTHTILGFEPVDYLDDVRRKETAGLLGAGYSIGNALPVGRLGSAGIRRGLVEIYDATTKSFVQALAAEARTAPIPFAHVSIDRWTANNDDFVGVRVSYLTRDFCAKSHLLAVKQYAPEKKLDDSATGRMMKVWVGQVLEEFGLQWSMVLGAVADNSPQISAAFQNLSGVLRESCIPLMLVHVIVDGFGLSPPPGKSKNESARDITIDVSNILKRVNQSRETQEAFPGLREAECRSVRRVGVNQSLTQEWMSNTVAIERFLVHLPSLMSYFSQQGRQKIEFSARNELLELYSLLKSLSQVIQVSQPSNTPSVPTAMQRMVLLLASDLDCTKPLELHEPSHYYTIPVVAGAPGELPARTERTVKHPEQLTEVGRRTRALLRDEVFRRFGLDRWGQNFERESHLFDMALALHPGCRQLQYMDKLSAESGDVCKIKNKVYAQIQQLVENVVVQERSTIKVRKAAVLGDSGVSEAQAENSSHEQTKRLKLVPPANHDMVNAMAKAGLFDAQITVDSDGEWENDSTPAEEAEDAVKNWHLAKLPASDRVINTGEGLAEFWRGQGTKRFRLLSVVARAVLGAPGCSAVVENDFATGGWPMAHPQTHMDLAYTEMVLFLRGAFRAIPREIPALSDEEVKLAVPLRFRDFQMRKQVSLLSSREQHADGNGLHRSIFGVEPSHGDRSILDEDETGEER